jgi:site-specific DNA-methyltransferase (adenine-specific)|tara:strand:- start:1694 stop:3355 length:1662 start_codon:yes stop_codon:yes gene_type:complete
MLPQLDLDLPPSTTMTIDEVASALQVSSASVRNWVKTGYLETDKGKFVSRSSFEAFQNSVVGTEKLTKRANKSKLDTHDHDALQAKFLAHIGQCKNVELEGLGDAYEGDLSNSHRNKEGVYYTPDHIVKRFFKNITGNVSELVFCDPCCGSGNFIIAALDHGFLPENIYGFDTDPVAVAITNARFKSRSGIASTNINMADFLHDVVLDDVLNIPSFDVVLTNPPWGKKLPPKDKDLLSKAFSCPKSVDTSALFFQAALRKSKPSSIIGMLLPEAFFNISSFGSTREAILKHKILSFVDFDKPFKGLMTKAKGLFVMKEKLSNIETSIPCETLTGTHFRSHKSFIKNPKTIFNFECDPQSSDLINHLYSLPHTTLDGKARWGLGIVTGNNKKFVSADFKDNYLPVFKGSEIQAGQLPKPKNFIPSDLTQYQQVASPDLYFSPEKLIYRFISSNLVFHHDTEGKLFLNSANMLVLENDVGISHADLAWLLNTKLMNWVFRQVFDTHKVLRSDLEALPIFFEYFRGSQPKSEDELLQYLGIEVGTDGTYRLKKQNL